MPRLIDANALIDEWNTLIKKMHKDSDGAYPVDFAIVISAVSKAPTVDAVEVVRCGECRLADTWKCPMSGTPGRVSASDFCSYGTKKMDGDGNG